MLLKCTRFVIAALLAFGLCPAYAFADETTGDSTDSPSSELVSGVTGAEREAIQKSTGTFESLQAPGLINTLNGFSAAEPLANGGILVGGASGYLFYLPQAAFKDASTGKTTGAYHAFLCYNRANNSWIELAPLPVYMEFCSAAIWNEKLYVSGTPMGSNGGVPAHAGNPGSALYSFDLSDESDLGGNWEGSLTSQVPVAASLVNNRGQLQVIGGFRNGAPSNIISAFDSASSTLETISEDMTVSVVGAQAVTNDNTLYLYTYGNTLTELQDGTGQAGMVSFNFETGETAQLSGSLPSITTPSDMSEYPSDRAVSAGSIDSADSGVILVGPTAANGSTDTYRMAWGAGSFGTYSRTLSKSQLSGAAATVYINNLYAVASIIDSSGNPAMVFGYTPMPNGVILSGNNGVWRKGSSKWLEFRFSPNFGRFSSFAQVDHSEIVLGHDYEATFGSTVISLSPEYLETLSVGEYLLTTWYDERQFPITARFVIEESASVIPEEGVNNPTQLAATGDPLPIVPIVVIAIVALAALSVAWWRHQSS